MNRTHEVVGTGVLIIGAGAAGLRTAIELVDRGVECLVLGKGRHGDAHTRMAAGGINASLGTRDPEDTWEIHFADTLREGHFVCDPRAVELLCRNAPERVRELRAWGCAFSETEDGEIDQRYFGAQSFRRTCFAGDTTGEAILTTLVHQARAVGVQWREDVFITRILTGEGGGAGGDGGRRAAGAAGWDLSSGGPVVFHAGAVVLAAGGGTSVYDRSTSRPDENNGDAVALAYEAGAELRDMEFVQFHPTGMVEPPDVRGQLVTEAARGEGGRLFNGEGRRFMDRYSPEQMELDARDVVARAIATEIREGRGTEAGAVLLDLTHLAADFIGERLPKLLRDFRRFGIDITRQPMQVAPTAHYFMGGVRVDFDTGSTRVRGLYAVGEATAGVHGANRLGGNSLAETVVFGQVTGAAVADAVATLPTVPPDGGQEGEALAQLDALAAADGGEDSEALAAELGSLLWEHAGIVRDGAGLRAGIRKLEKVKRRAKDVGVSGGDGAGFQSALNLGFTLRAAEALLRSALMRDESRGAHFRSDAPEEDSDRQWTTVIRKGASGAMELRVEPVPPVPPEFEEVLEKEYALDYHHLE